MGEKLRCLWVHGSTGLLGDFKMSHMYTVPNLRQLYLIGVLHRVDKEDFERGMAHLM